MIIRTGLAGAFCALAACADLTGLGPTPALVQKVALYDGSVTAGAPSDYCVETRVSRTSDGFAVLAACDAISGSSDRPVINGFVTIQVGAAGTGLDASDAAALAGMLTTTSGKALLSQNGDPDDITVHGTAQTGDGLTVRFTDAAAPPAPGLQSTEWRGFLDVSGRLTTVSVRGLAQAPLGTDEGQVLLTRAIAAMRAANDNGDS